MDYFGAGGLRPIWNWRCSASRQERVESQSSTEKRKYHDVSICVTSIASWSLSVVDGKKSWNIHLPKKINNYCNVEQMSHFYMQLCYWGSGVIEKGFLKSCCIQIRDASSICLKIDRGSNINISNVSFIVFCSVRGATLSICVKNPSVVTSSESKQIGDASSVCFENWQRYQYFKR